MTLAVLVRGGAHPAGPTDGLPLTRGSSIGDRRTKTKAMAWIGVVAESQKSESSPEDHPAKKWVEDRNHSMKPKQRELRIKKFTSKEQQDGKTRRWCGRIPKTNRGCFG